MNIIIYIIVGAIAGYIAGKIMHEESGNIIIDCVIGIIGGFVGTFLIGLIGFKPTNVIDNVIVAMLGACVVLIIKRAFLNRG